MYSLLPGLLYPKFLLPSLCLDLLCWFLMAKDCDVCTHVHSEGQAWHQRAIRSSVLAFCPVWLRPCCSLWLPNKLLAGKSQRPHSRSKDACCPACAVGAEDLNSGPDACTAGPLHTEHLSACSTSFVLHSS